MLNKSLKERSRIIRIREEYIDDTDDAIKVRPAEHNANIKRGEKTRQSQRINPYHEVQWFFSMF